MTSKSKLMSFIAECERRNRDSDIAAFKKRSGYDLDNAARGSALLTKRSLESSPLNSA